jgi:hypothetical protein
MKTKLQEAKNGTGPFFISYVNHAQNTAHVVKTQ